MKLKQIVKTVSIAMTISALYGCADEPMMRGGQILNSLLKKGVS